MPLGVAERKRTERGMAMGDISGVRSVELINWKGEVKKKKEKIAPSLCAYVDSDTIDGVRRKRGTGFRGKE